MITKLYQNFRQKLILTSHQNLGTKIMFNSIFFYMKIIIINLVRDYNFIYISHSI